MNRKATILLLLISGWTLAELRGQTFRDVSISAGIDAAAEDFDQMAGGVIWFDYDGDYHPDLLLLNGVQSVRLYRNDWDGTFTDVTEAAGLLGQTDVMGGVAADFDGDGDQDLFFSTFAGLPNRLLRRESSGRFTDISREKGFDRASYGAGVSRGDLDGDGDLDIYCVNYLAGRTPEEGGQPNFLFRNDGNLNFTEIGGPSGVADSGCGLGSWVGDLDRNGAPDIYVANDFGYAVQPSAFFRQENGRFHSVAEATGTASTINAMGIAPGDFDRDGDWDFYVTNIRDNPFYENIDGTGNYVDRSPDNAGLALAERTGWGAAFADFDLDGWLDLAVANGQIAEAVNEPEAPAFFRNPTDGTPPVLQASDGLEGLKVMGRGLAIADYDLDGLPDVAVNVVNRRVSGTETARLLRNESPTTGEYLHVAAHPTSVSLELYADGNRQLRAPAAGSSYLSQNGGPIHFSASAGSRLDSLVVHYSDGSQLVYAGMNWGDYVALRRDGEWSRVLFSKEVNCGGAGGKVTIKRDEEENEAGEKTIRITRAETEVYAWRTPLEVRLYAGDQYRGAARYRDEVLVDTIELGAGCPVLREVAITIISGGEAGTVFPNPTAGTVRIVLPAGESRGKVAIISSSGRVMGERYFEVETGATLLPFDLRGLPRGGYLLRLRTANHSVVQKIYLQ